MRSSTDTHTFIFSALCHDFNQRPKSITDKLGLNNGQIKDFKIKQLVILGLISRK